jgi:hypothetical protein
MKVYSYSAIGRSGMQYSVRLMLDPQELHHLQAEGLVPLAAVEVVGMQAHADMWCAAMECEAFTASGGLLQ